MSNFYPPDFVGRGSEKQRHVGENFFAKIFSKEITF